ncbi:hypothetical protein NDU88_007662 [Pleurodeles waltl]|uniref:Uncharacterized protein n=1 Tax=Pleurodeles waltl TaxID=8319 RepID=A0AAV7ST46_PLEWA|nr:hypothetical protein NDU88_007662 [Pleurodeles waltl]
MTGTAGTLRRCYRWDPPTVLPLGPSDGVLVHPRPGRLLEPHCLPGANSLCCGGGAGAPSHQPAQYSSRPPVASCDCSIALSNASSTGYVVIVYERFAEFENADDFFPAVPEPPKKPTPLRS